MRNETSRRPTPTIIHPGRVPAWMINLAIVVLIVALWPIGMAVDKNIELSAVDVLIKIGISVILAVSLNLINGITGQFSLGHAGFMAVGAYIGGVLLKHIEPTHSQLVLLFPGILLLGGLVAALVGIVVGIPTLRLGGD